MCLLRELPRVSCTSRSQEAEIRRFGDKVRESRLRRLNKDTELEAEEEGNVEGKER